ncbi:MAG: MalY/PatB family protein [Thomasclavelia sp.]
MKYDFDQIHNRINTYCTQWDYIEDRFSSKDIIPFSISDTDFIVPKPITDKIIEVANHQIYGYTRWNHHDYKSAITSYFQRRFDTYLDEDWIVYSPSVMYSISLLLRLLTKPQDKILTFDPMYDAFLTVITDNKRQLISHNLINDNGKFIIDFNVFKSQLKDCQVLLLCSPHNPTGRIWNHEEMEEIIRLAKKYNVKIISDEIHMDIQLGENKHLPLMKFYQEYQNIYTVSSSSKTFNTPGLIGSYAIIPNHKIKEAFLYHTRKRDFLNSASIFGMYATMVGYKECDDYIDQLNEYIKGNMQLVKSFIDKELPDFKFTIPDGTYLAWLDVRNVPFTSKQIQEALVKVGKVGIMSGETYGKNGTKYLRMNVGCPRSKVVIGLQGIKKAMETLYQQ